MPKAKWSPGKPSITVGTDGTLTFTLTAAPGFSAWSKEG